MTALLLLQLAGAMPDMSTKRVDAFLVETRSNAALIGCSCPDDLPLHVETTDERIARLTTELRLARSERLVNRLIKRARRK